MMALDEFSRLLTELYGAAMDDTRWNDVSRLIAESFSTHSCTLQVRNGRDVRVIGITDNVEPSMVDEYREHYRSVDIWSNYALTRPFGQAWISHELMTARALNRTEHYAFFRKADIVHVVASSMSVGENEVALIGVHHNGTAGEFGEPERRHLQRLIPHLQRALQMRSTFLTQAIRRDMALAALDSLVTPLLLTDASGKVLYANRPAVELLRRDQGLLERQGRLCCESPEMTHKLLARIGENSRREIIFRRPSELWALAVPRAGGRPLSVRVAPVQAGELGAIASVPMAMLLVSDGEQGSAQVESLQALFGLTPAEARLASELANGDDLDTIAFRKGVSKHTIRSMLKTVMLKTSTHRQGELVSLVLRYAMVPPP
ncbi:helix-turn-helix transcriptional regulator [Burkholderia guangdongensis]|uniref:helix-turn-helix transcriptional regulator n=1 Tax=Burkholderia guangdongensis TaxID=1792500 RepID=UPI0015CD07D4|nr:hypothetical protein [Burkholderia guangdongensis]